VWAFPKAIPILKPNGKFTLICNPKKLMAGAEKSALNACGQ